MDAFQPLSWEVNSLKDMTSKEPMNIGSALAGEPSPMSKKNKHRYGNIGKEEVLTFKEFKSRPFDVIQDLECITPPVTGWKSNYNPVTGLWEEDDSEESKWGNYLC